MKRIEIEPTQPRKARTVSLRHIETPQQALRAIALETLDQLQTNAAALAASDDSEFVHQLRVALRRLRAARAAFKAIAPCGRRARIEPELKWLSALCGRVRDLDVLLTETLPPIEAALPSAEAIAALKKIIARTHEKYRAELLRAVASRRYARLLQQLRSWLPDDAAPDAQQSPALRQFAGQALRKSHRRVRRQARDWQSLSPEARHALRKKAKALRYACEFFSTLYDKKPVKRYLADLQALQQILGDANDGVVARGLLHAFIDAEPALNELGLFIDGWLGHRSHRANGELQQAIERWQRSELFWRA